MRITFDKEQFKNAKHMMLELSLVKELTTEDQQTAVRFLINSILKCELVIGDEVVQCTQLVDNFKHWNKLFLHYEISHTKAGTFISLTYYPGVLTLNIVDDESDSELPSWIGYVETQRNVYFRYGTVERAGDLHRSYKFRKKYAGVRTNFTSAVVERLHNQKQNKNNEEE